MPKSAPTRERAKRIKGEGFVYRDHHVQRVGRGNYRIIDRHAGAAPPLHAGSLSEAYAMVDAMIERSGVAERGPLTKLTHAVSSWLRGVFDVREVA